MATISIHDAARSGDADTVRVLVKDLGADVNETDDDGETPLHVACWQGHTEAARVLMKELGARIEEREIEGRTPLHLACEQGHTDTVRVLVEFGANLNAADGACLTPLLSASLNGRTDTMRVLVEELGADVTATNERRENAVHVASEHGHADAVRVLVKELGVAVNTKNGRGMTPLHIAAFNGHIETLRVLGMEGAQVDVRSDSGENALHSASRLFRTDVVRVLVKELGVNVNSKDRHGMTALHLTLLGRSEENRHVQTARVLAAELGADLWAMDSWGRTALHVACENGRVVTVRMLVKEMGVGARGASVVDGNCLPPIHTTSVVTTSLDIVNARDKYGWTALHLASLYNNPETIRVLVKELGADVDAENINSRTTSLHLVASRGTLESLRALLELGANVNTMDSSGRTPLHLASAERHADAVRVLADEMGADVNAKEKYGKTPVEVAAGPDTVRALVMELGAGIDMTDDAVESTKTNMCH